MRFRSNDIMAMEMKRNDTVYINCVSLARIIARLLRLGCALSLTRENDDDLGCGSIPAWKGPMVSSLKKKSLREVRCMGKMKGNTRPELVVVPPPKSPLHNRSDPNCSIVWGFDLDQRYYETEF